jgi:benzoate-CoA ligase family protein
VETKPRFRAPQLLNEQLNNLNDTIWAGLASSRADISAFLISMPMHSSDSPAPPFADLAGRPHLSEEVNDEGIPRLRFPEPFNCAEYFVDRHLAEGRGSKVAVQARQREVTYAELLDNVNRMGNTLAALGIGRGERVLMVVNDCPEFFFLFWGAVKTGAIPVPLNALLRSNDFAFLIQDSECAALVYSSEFAGEVENALQNCLWQPRVVLRLQGGSGTLTARAREASPELRAIPTRAQDDCFWLYSSGTTGKPKGVILTHADLPVISHFYTEGVLGATESDVFFSVARLFFSYGLGAAMAASLWVGGTAILDERRQTPQTVIEVFRRYAPTILAAVPTFYARMLAAGVLTKHDVPRLRRCLSAGEPLPPELYRLWLEATGVPILDGIGSTEVGYIYISNGIGDIRPGASGKPVRGYQVRIVDEAGNSLADERPGRLLVKGQSVMKRYWNNPEKTAKVLVDGWFDSGDIFRRDEDGYYIYCGRHDDMLKVSGRWVSPFEIESTLVEHPKVLEAAVVGQADENGLVKTQAWVVLKDSATASEATAEEIRVFCRSKLAPYKFPKWINFVHELPKTTTGKIQRYKLRALKDNAEVQ